MVNIQKFPFTYEVKAPKNGGTNEFIIDTPWLDEYENWQDGMQHDEIYQTDDLKLFEQRYDNGFHVMFIQFPDKIIIKSNWALDYNSREDKYLPRIQ